MITSEQLRIEELRLKYLELLKRPDVFPTLANWQFISSNSLKGLCALLYGKYMTALTVDDNDRENLHDVAIEEFPKYLTTVDRAEAVGAIYGDVDTDRKTAESLIRQNGLFDAESLLKLLKNGETDFAISLLDIYQPEYSTDDVKGMDALLEFLDNLPVKGKIENRAGIFGTSEKYICPEGHANPSEEEYCRHSGCGKNIRGLTEVQEQKILQYSKRIEALKSLLSSESEAEKL